MSFDHLKINLNQKESSNPSLPNRNDFYLTTYLIDDCLCQRLLTESVKEGNRYGTLQTGNGIVLKNKNRWSCVDQIYSVVQPGLGQNHRLWVLTVPLYLCLKLSAFSIQPSFQIIHSMNSLQCSCFEDHPTDHKVGYRSSMIGYTQPTLKNLGEGF